MHVLLGKIHFMIIFATLIYKSYLHRFGDTIQILIDKSTDSPYYYSFQVSTNQRRNGVDLMIKAVIFDMDGIIIDSEPLWQEAEIAAFGRVGLKLTRELCMQTMGIRVDEVVQYWYTRRPWQGKTVGEVEEDILDTLEGLIEEKGEAMQGVGRMLDLCETKNLRIALASSSYMRLINTVLKKLDLVNRFEVVHSGEFETYGKPHPAIFLTTLQKMDLVHSDAFVVEDSFAGVIAAKAARLQVVCVPEKSLRNKSVYDIAELKLNSLADFSESHFAGLNNNATDKVL